VSKQKTWQRLRDEPALFNQYLVREEVMDTIRAFFKGRDYQEVFTPMLVPVPSAEANLEVFETELKTAGGLKRPGYLIMSPEHAIKKLLAAGIGKVFELSRCFRNQEEVSRAHNPEFTMLEWYHTGADYTAVMTEFEELFLKIIKSVQKTVELNKWTYQGNTYDLTPPWPRISVAEAFERYAGIEADALVDEAALKAYAKEKGFGVNKTDTWEQVFYQIFFNQVEPRLNEGCRPYFLYDYPLAQAALARPKKSDPRFAERFEVFVAGLELGNCFSELIDAREQARRFENDLAERQKQGKSVYPMDQELIEALKSGLPEVAGIAVGVDRLVMLAADVPSIAETLFFPAKELFEL
jgi:elongation factor P--(R)-beta-lysine ligase